MQDSQNQPLRPLNTNHIGNTKDKLFDLTAPGSKALKAASEHRAKIVTFYINGEPFRAGIRVSIVPGKDFHSLTSLYDYLNGKSQVTFGVRYIFTTTGKRVTSIDDLESGSSYVISNNNRFQVMPYGKTDKPKGGDTGYGGQNNGLAPLEGKSVSSTLPFATLPAVLGHSPRSQSLNSKEGKIVTIVNRKDPTLRTRVFLNLRSQRTFELVIKDLGQAVMVKDARRLYTSDGEEIRSISQLRRQLSDFTIFYIESAKNRSNIKPSFIHKQRSNSLESINLQGFKDDELEAIETHRNQDISTDYQFKYPVTSLTSSEQFNPTETETATKLWTPNDNDFKSMENRWSNEEPKSEEVTVKTIATQTSPKLRQPRLRVKRKLGPSKIGKAMLVDKSTENSVKSETEGAVEVIKKPNSQPNESKAEKSKKQDKLFTRPNKSGKQSNQNVTKSATNDSSKLNQLTHHDTKRQSTRSSAKSGNSVEPVIFVPISVDDPAIGGDKTNGFDGESRDELKNNQITKEDGKMSMMKENAGNESAKAKDYNSLSDEERVKLFSDLIKDKIKLKIENRRKEKKSSEHRSGTSTSFDRGSLASFGDADRLSVLEKIAHEDYMDDHLSLASKSPAQPIDQENLFKGINVPDKNFQLSWIYGYKGNHKSENNLIILDSGELVFFVAAIVVLWNPQNQTQRHYKEHISDIQCMALNEQDKFIATAHENVLSNGSLFSSSEIRVWDSSNLITSAVYDNLSPSTSLISISFTNLGFLLILCYKENVSLIVWDWKNNQEIATINAKLSKDIKLIGAKPLPQGSNIITYGHRHLTFWQLVGSKYNPINLIKPKSKEPILFTSIDFLSNGDFLTGTADGYFTIWSQNPETGLVFRVTDLKGHEASIECIKYLSNNVLVSTDSNGQCISWDIGDLAFKHLNTIMVPQNAGGITSLCLPINTDGNPNFNVYIGTRGNCIAHGSVVSGKEFNVLLEGHSGGLRGITSLSRDTSFFSCGLDSKVCRWGNKKLAWKTLLDVQLLSIAVHPLCQALAIGGVNGVIQILEVESGSLAAQLNVCKAPIVCLAYSPNGNFLAAGAHDGVMYLLPVFDDGFVYEKVSVLKGPHPILSLQWSVDNCFLLTSVNDNNYQELIIWDLPNFRYLTGISSSSENLKWHDATCSGGEDVRGIWDNHNIDDVVNVCCHCSNNGKYLVTGDEDGNIRLFSYPCSNPMSAFYARKQGSKGVVEARFISQDSAIVSGNFDGAIFVWNLYDP